MLIAITAIFAGILLLLWSADRFVEGAAAIAQHAGLPPLLIGMVIVGFGTSAPEIVVSAIAALEGNPSLALGNAIGSNIVNIGLILGIVALIAPISVHSAVIRRELPLLVGASIVVGIILLDNGISLMDALILLGLFAGFMIWSIYTALKQRDDAFGQEMEQELATHAMSRARALLWLSVGLLILIASSRLLVWGAVNVAQQLGMSDLIIGLTIVALGTSLPELAASLIAVRKGEHDIAVGNVVGSNLFNILAVVGIAGVINPMSNLTPAIVSRDWSTMMLITAILFLMTIGLRVRGRLNRIDGGVLLVIFIAYNLWLVHSVTST